MQVPVSGEVVTLPVERHLGEQEEGHKEYRVVRRSHVFAGREGEISTQYIDMIVTEPEE